VDDSGVGLILLAILAGTVAVRNTRAQPLPSWQGQ